MIRTVFTLANNIAKHFRISPTAIIDGREPAHLEKRVLAEEEYQLQRAANEQIFKAQQATTTCPFQREKQQIIYNFADDRNPTTFEEAWIKLDEVQQRQSDHEWKEYKGQ